MDKLILAFCRLGFAGLSPIMPGTCGSALAAVLAPFLFIPLPFVARIVVLVLVFWIGGDGRDPWRADTRLQGSG